MSRVTLFTDAIGASRQRRGFSLIELVVALILIMIILMLITPTVRSLIDWSRIRQDMTNIDQVIHKTMGQSLARGSSGRVRIENGSVIGEVQLPDATFIEVDRVSPSFSSFGRSNNTETPWLGLATTTQASSFAGHTIPITGLGTINPPGGAVFVNYGKNEAVLEILISGVTVIHYQKQESDLWSQ